VLDWVKSLDYGRFMVKTRDGLCLRNQGRRKQCEAAGAAIAKGHFIFLGGNIC
jgi:hypothetical protein